MADATDIADADAPAPRTRMRPALSVRNLADQSGGTVCDVLLGVPAFHPAAQGAASGVSATLGFQRVCEGVAAILAKLGVIGAVNAPEAIPAMAELVEHEEAMSVYDANTIRLVVNGMIETCAYHVARYAEAKGLTVPYACRVSGPFAVVDGALVELPAHARVLPGVAVTELAAAFQRWADALATMAALVNAEIPEIPVSAPVAGKDATAA